MNTEQQAMNTHYQRMMTGVQSNAERDMLLARAASDPAALAKAQARLDTVQAALEIYAAAHKLAHGSRPWPRPAGEK